MECRVQASALEVHEKAATGEIKSFAIAQGFQAATQRPIPLLHGHGILALACMKDKIDDHSVLVDSWI